jgi:hypothetical protein
MTNDDEDVIASTNDGRVRVRLVLDDHPFNPRADYDNLGHAITLGPSWQAPIDQDAGPLASGWARIADRENAVELFTRWARTFYDAIVIESASRVGPAALWYLLGEDARDLPPAPEAYLDAERQEYEAWAEGEVYAWVIEKRVTWTTDDDEVDQPRHGWEAIDSCGGHYGHDWATHAAHEALDLYLKARQPHEDNGSGPTSP